MRADGGSKMVQKLKKEVSMKNIMRIAVCAALIGSVCGSMHAVKKIKVINLSSRGPIHVRAMGETTPYGTSNLDKKLIPSGETAEFSVKRTDSPDGLGDIVKLYAGYNNDNSMKEMDVALNRTDKTITSIIVQITDESGTLRPGIVWSGWEPK